MASRQRIDAEIQAYLRELRRHLRGLPHTEGQEIVRELECHLRDKLADTPDDGRVLSDVLSRFGAPRDLASAYRASRAVSRARRSTTPPRVLAAAILWARVSVHGVWVLLVAATGYFVSASFLTAAVLKPLVPRRTGLWRLPEGEYSLRLGLGAIPQAGEELLGWWVIPLGLALGGLLFWAITLYARSALLTAKRRLSASLPDG